MIVREVLGQDAAEVCFRKNEDVVQTFASYRTDEPFRERILPRAVRGRDHLPDSHVLHSLPESVTVDAVAIAEEIGRRGVVRAGVHDLLGGPVGSGMLGHVEMHDSPAMMSEHDEDEEHVQVGGRHGEEIDRDEVADMVGQERAPGLRGRSAPLGHEPGDGPLGHLDAELEKFPMDAPAASRPTPWTGRSRRADRFGAASVGSWFAYRRRVLA